MHLPNRSVAAFLQSKHQDLQMLIQLAFAFRDHAGHSHSTGASPVSWLLLAWVNWGNMAAVLIAGALYIKDLAWAL